MPTDADDPRKTSRGAVPNAGQNNPATDLPTPSSKFEADEANGVIHLTEAELYRRLIGDADKDENRNEGSAASDDEK